MKTLVTLFAAAVLLVPLVGWAQSAPATQPPQQAPQSLTNPPAASSPATPAPGAPGVPGDRVARDGRIFGLSPLAAIILGLVILGVIIALMASRRRDRDVVVDTRIDADVPPERPFGTTETELERERRRRAS